MKSLLVGAAVAGLAVGQNSGCAANGCTECYRSDWGAPCFGGGGRAACETEWNGVWCGGGSGTPPVPVPPSPPVATSAGDVFGMWEWTWTGRRAAAPPGANMAVSFSGWSDLNRALGDSKLYPGLGTLLDLGGGNDNGIWYPSTVAGIDAAYLARVKAAGYVGIAYDVEKCRGGVSAAEFGAAFARTKAAGLVVLVSVSHSKPYDCVNGEALMSAFIRDPNVDIMNPQLYTTGNEPRPDFTAVGTQWAEFKQKPASQKFAPSVGHYGHYPEVVAYFDRIGLTCQGFFQWQQNPSVSVPVPTSPPATTTAATTTAAATTAATTTAATTTAATTTAATTTAATTTAATTTAATTTTATTAATTTAATTTTAAATTTASPVTTAPPMGPGTCRRVLRNWDDCRFMAADECCAPGRSCQGHQWWKTCRLN